MNYLYKYLAVGCVTVMASLSGVAMAAPSPDDAPQTDAAADAKMDAAPIQQLGTSLADIDVASYLIRNLYREPDKDANDLDKWFRGWALSLYWNPNLAVHAEDANKDDLSMSGLGFAVSKDVSPASTFRLDYSYRSNQGFNALVKRQRLSIDYLFNITNFYYGYDLSREHEWLLSMGIQAGTSMNQAGSRDTLSHVKPVNTKLGWGGVHMGIQYRKNISNDLAFFMEQQFELNSDNWDGMNNQYDVDPAINLLVGLVYRLGAPKRNIVPDDEEHHYRWYDNTFMQVYGGLSKMMSNDISNAGLTFDGAGEYSGKMPGLNFGFNVGKWLNPSLGFRLGYFEQVMGHNSKPDPAAPHMSYSNFMTLRGGRAELLFNPLAVFADRISVGRIGWELAAGLEAGQFHLHHYGYNNYIQYHAQNKDVTFDNNGKLTLGLSLSTQLKYFVNNHTALFVEGRMSDLKYNTSTEDGFSRNTETKESIYSASLGLEYYLSGWDRYSRFSRWDTYETRPVDRLAPNKRLYLEAAMGLGHQIHWGEHFPNMFDIEGTVGIGMRYNNYFGGRARFSYSYRSKDIAITSVHGVNPVLGRMSSIYRGSLDATFNLTNLWMGLDHNGTRLGDVYLFAGPAIAGYNADIEAGKLDQLTIGGNVGMQLTRRITPEWEIFLEPRYEFYQKYITNRWDLLAGVIYNYNAEKNEEHKGELTKWANRWFMETGLGAGLDASEQLLGGSARLGFGRRFNPFSSLRLNGMFTLLDLTDKAVYVPGEQKHSFKMGVGVDYMLNLTNLWYGVNPFRNTNLRAFAGPTFNLSGVTRSLEHAQIRMGVEAGLQWSYDIADNLSLFVEPRAEVFPSFLTDYYNTRMDVLLGATWYNDYHTWRANRLFYNDDAHYPWALVESGYVRPGQKSIDADLRNGNWFWEAGAGLHFPMGNFNEDLSKLKLFSPSLTFGLGYQFDDLQAVRLMGSFVKTDSQLYSDPTSFLMLASLDYRFNLTNLVMGINPYRPMDAYLFAGPEVRLLDWTRPEIRNSFALGVMGGAHLAYHLNQNLDLFAEGRYSNYSFASDLNKHLMRDKNAIDRLHNNVTGFMGVTWYNKEFDRASLTPWDDASHTNNWFYQAAGGISHALLMKDKKASLMQTNSLSGFAAMGYAFTPLHSLRLTGTMHMKSTPKYDMDGRKMVAQLGLDYMFNASRFVLGENPYRRFDLQLLAGPLARLQGVNSNTEETGFGFGANAGAQLSYHLNRNFDLFGEARYDFWQGKLQERADLYAGLAYYGRTQDQRTKQIITDPTARQNNWFWSAMAGVTHPMGGWDGQLSAFELFNPMYSAGFGYTWGPYSSVRFMGNFANIRNDIWPNDRRRSYLMYGDVDYMFNLTNLMMGQDNYRPVDFFVFGGPSVRFENFTQADEKNTFAFGLNIGGQLNYHLTNNIDLFGEARYENWENFKSINRKLDADKQHNVWDLFVGTTYYTAPLDRNTFRPYDENYRYGNWFYQGALGLSHPTLARKKGLNESAAAFAAMGYQFDKLQSLRFNVTGMRHLKTNGGTDVEGRNLLASAGIDYMFNATNALLGENPYRRFDVQLLAGPAVRLVNFNSDDLANSLVFGASAGGQLLYHLNRSFDIFGEARYDFWAGKWQERMDAFAGVTYFTKPQDMRTGNWVTDEKSHSTNWFAEAAIGTSLPLESTNVPGVSDKIGIGYVFGPYSTVRANMINHWHLNRSMDTKEKHQYVMAGDLEYMLNVTNLMFNDSRRRVEVLPFVGGATRIENVTKADANIQWNWGAILGGQINYHLTQFTDLFAEGQYEKWFDGRNEDRLSAYIGTRFYDNGYLSGISWGSNGQPAPKPVKPVKQPTTRRDRDGQPEVIPARPDDPENHMTWFVDLGLGIGGSVAPIYGKSGVGAKATLGKFKYIDPTIHAGAGVHFNPYLSARARANVTYVGDKHVNETMEDHSFIFETSLDGMWNMTNTMFGINPDRRFDVYSFAGPTLLLENITEKDHQWFAEWNGKETDTHAKFHFGVNVGARLAYHINNNVDLVGEGRADWLDRSNHYYNRIEAMLGTSFRIDNRVRKSVKQLTTDRLYLQILGGYQIASMEGTSLFKYSQSNWGKMPNLDYRIGRHFNEVWSLQASAFSQQVNYHDWKKNDGNHVAHYGLRGEAAVNVLNMFNTQYDSFNSRFNWTMSAGVQVSRLVSEYNDKISDFGVTAATQAQYRLTDLTWALAELRTQTVNLKGVHMPIVLQLGLQHDLRDASKSKKVGEAINDNRNHWQISAGAGAYNGKRGGFEGALIYRFAKNSALRLKGEAFNNGYPQPDGTGKLGGYVAVGADYMANVTNVLLGIDDYRRTNLYMFGGPSIVTRGFFQSLKNKDFSALTGTFNNGISISYGAHADVKLNKKLSVYGEARFVNLTDNTDLFKVYRDKVNLFTTIGLKYNLPK